MKIKYETSAGGIVFKRIENCKLKIVNYLWLISQHSQHKGWVFPKGLVGDKDLTESMKTAAIREVGEEGGIKAKIINNQPVKVQYSYHWNNILVKKTVYYFLMEYISGDPKDHDWEMMDAKFVTEDEVKKTLTYESDKQAFEKILKSL
jgi:8-oxo-dGTP pyrophosphatase MutT (NUDIX family)